MKENYVSGFFENSGENVVNYFLSLQENPLKLIPVILDIAIVIYVISLIIIKVFDRDELYMLPLYRKISKKAKF